MTFDPDYADRVKETLVVNRHKESFDEYIGRGTIFGNPFELGRDGDRVEVLEKYKKWFNFLLRDDRFVSELKKLKNKTLGCSCKPDLCHGDIIKDWFDKTPSLSENVLDDL